jgi:hypothetical protein
MSNATSGNSSVRHIVLCAAVGLATLCSAPTGAAPEDPAINTCRSAFISQLTKDGSVAGEFRVTFLNQGYVATEAQYLTGGKSFDLLARESKTDRPVATVTCNVDAGGSVLAILEQNMRRGPALAARR